MPTHAHRPTFLASEVNLEKQKTFIYEYAKEFTYSLIQQDAGNATKKVIGG